MRVVRVAGSWIVECCARFRSSVSKARSCISFVAFSEVRPAATAFELLAPAVETRASDRLALTGIVNGSDSEPSAVPLEVEVAVAVDAPPEIPEAHSDSATAVVCSQALAT